MELKKSCLAALAALVWWMCFGGVAVYGQARRNTECPNSLIPSKIFVDEKGTPTTLAFGTAVDFDTIGYPIERVHIELVRETWAGEMDTAIYHYAGSWRMRYQDSTAEEWARMLAPKNLWQDEMAVGKVNSGCFLGQVDVDNRYRRIHIHGVIRRMGAGPLIGEWRHTTHLEPEKLEVPRLSSKAGDFQVVADPLSRYYLIQGHVPRGSDLSVFLVDDQDRLIGVITQANGFSGRYRRILDYGNTRLGNYFLHVRIDDALQVLPIPKR